MTTLLDRTISHIQNNQLIEPSSPCLLAFSAGPDSMFLAHVLNNILDPGLLTFVYFDHGLRAEALEERQFVDDFAKKLQRTFFIESLPVKSYAKTHHVSIEMAGRTLRYEALVRLAAANNIKNIATAHHLDDACESFMLKLIRGAKSGLGGIQKRSYLANNIELIRPLLTTTKSEILDYLYSKNIEFMIDKTNSNHDFARNNIRHQIMPIITSINASYQNTWLRMFDFLDDQRDFIISSCQDSIEQIQINEHQVSLQIHLICKYHPFMQKFLIRYLWEKFSKNHTCITDVHIQKLFKHLPKSRIFQISLPNQSQGIIRDGLLIFTKKQETPAKFQYQLLKIPSLLKIKENNQTISFKIKPALDDQPKTEEQSVLYLDYDLLSDYPLVIRSRKNGDRFQPFGCGFVKKLSDYFIDHKIPRQLREQIPLIFHNKELICITGHQIADSYKVTASTKRILQIAIT